jgi:hypothetical protein
MHRTTTPDSVSMLRASNARLAALVGDSSRASQLLSEAKKKIEKTTGRALPVRTGAV